ncbi:hypothetical protein KY290_006537 [Solanum tuberosum]|uniref:Uncharacterized protein n=1 Tax=Solanum tuberosum TaxID=4113 RepID=A0ABQ7WHQ7_SOLTU|nr:hypothetical protein KY290_006537 [Solanum tuberosum]
MWSEVSRRAIQTESLQLDDVEKRHSKFILSEIRETDDETKEGEVHGNSQQLIPLSDSTPLNYDASECSKEAEGKTNQSKSFEYLDYLSPQSKLITIKKLYKGELALGNCKLESGLPPFLQKLSAWKTHDSGFTPWNRPNSTEAENTPFTTSLWFNRLIQSLLWLMIAKHVIEQEKGTKRENIRKAIAFLKETDALLKIEDILPFFPDFALIDDFKKAVI